MSESVANVLLVARKRGFWNRPEATQFFPQRILLDANPSKGDYVFALLKMLCAVVINRPDCIFFGTSMPILDWFCDLRRRGLFQNPKVVTDNQFIQYKDLNEIDVRVVYSRDEIRDLPTQLQERCRFTHFPSKVEDVSLNPIEFDQPYIFSGGRHRRDFQSLFRAIEGLDVTLKIATDTHIDLDEVPKNCELLGRVTLDEYVNYIRSSLFVVCPLQEGNVPHGHSEIGISHSVGTVVVSTRSGTVGEYIDHDVNGILVPAGSVTSYRSAICTLLSDSDELARLENGVNQIRKRYLYRSYGQFIRDICNETVGV